MQNSRGMSEFVTTIDGIIVPCCMGPSQIKVMFPAGLAGLREDVEHAVYSSYDGLQPWCDLNHKMVFPDAQGNIMLDHRKRYTMKHLGTLRNSDWPVPGSAGPATGVLPYRKGPVVPSVSQDRICREPASLQTRLNEGTECPSSYTHDMAHQLMHMPPYSRREEVHLDLAVNPRGNASSHQQLNFITYPPPGLPAVGNGTDRTPNLRDAAWDVKQLGNTQRSLTTLERPEEPLCRQTDPHVFECCPTKFREPSPVPYAAEEARSCSRSAHLDVDEGHIFTKCGTMKQVLENPITTMHDELGTESNAMNKNPTGTPKNGKIIRDCVYQHADLPPLAVQIIDTPEFQRLRNIKQLGTVVFLYPGATHTRFEHCIGVAHLASTMVIHLAQKQPELDISDADILCVTIGGLCHDLGHGPFSHLFEKVVNSNSTDVRDHTVSEKQHSVAGECGVGRAGTPYNDIFGTSGKRTHERWHHENMSIHLFRKIMSTINIEEHKLNEMDVTFIEYCIKGLSVNEPWPNGLGRPERKRFLLDIVANKRNGIDVDRLDYFSRDSLSVYGRDATDFTVPRLLSACRVLEFNGAYQICFEEKMALCLNDIFERRAKLHKYVYQHRIVKIIDEMVQDVLVAADPFFCIQGVKNSSFRISQCIGDTEAFCQLGDWILEGIKASPDSRLTVAKDILSRLYRRDLYSVVGTATFREFRQNPEKDDILAYLVKDVMAEVRQYYDKNLDKQLRDSLIISFTNITYGSTSSDGTPDDPVSHVTFYNPKNTPITASELPRDRSSPLFCPREFFEQSVMVMTRDTTYMVQMVKAFDKWKHDMKGQLRVAVPNDNTRTTPSEKNPIYYKSRRMRDDTLARSQNKISRTEW